uniref:Uncharacterized protein n=1 Tax=Rhipicephalus pulchellus TaxID=72859 RepID=L7LXG7_RHIPC
MVGTAKTIRRAAVAVTVAAAASKLFARIGVAYGGSAGSNVGTRLSLLEAARRFASRQSSALSRAVRRRDERAVTRERSCELASWNIVQLQPDARNFIRLLAR